MRASVSIFTPKAFSARALPQLAIFRPHGSDVWIIEPASLSHSIEFWDQPHGRKVSSRGIIDSTIPSPEIRDKGPWQISEPPIRITLAPRAPLLPAPSSQ